MIDPTITNERQNEIAALRRQNEEYRNTIGELTSLCKSYESILRSFSDHNLELKDVAGKFKKTFRGHVRKQDYYNPLENTLKKCFKSKNNLEKELNELEAKKRQYIALLGEGEMKLTLLQLE